MEAQLAQFTNRGMFQDTSISKASNEFAFKNYNIRITAIDSKTLLSVTNERLPKELEVSIIPDLIPNKLSIRNATSSTVMFYLEYPAEESVVFTINNSNTVGINKGKSYYRMDGSVDDISSIKIILPTNGVGKKYLYYYDVININNIDYIPGSYLGHSIINDNIVLFTKDEIKDYIILLSLNESKSKLNGYILYSGNLNFSLDHPIEATSFYESDKVQKVYWVDNYNSPRFINIKDGSVKEKDATQFEFTPELKSFPSVTIEKKYEDGLFPAGTIQYFISYYNKYGTETGIIWASDLQYMTQSDRAESPENSTNCSFTLSINDVDTSFEYIKIYSLQRTSLNNTPIANLVVDAKINGNTFTFTDTNNNIASIDPTSLMFLGGNKFIASTLSQKDNTIFFGNIESTEYSIPDNIKNYIKSTINSNNISSLVSFGKKTIVTNEDSNQLDYSSRIIKTFKNSEVYRFAIQFQDKTGRWTQPLWVGDAKPYSYPKFTNNILELNTAKFNMNSTLHSLVKDKYVKYRLLIAEASNSDRSILAQGIVSPTVFNHAERVNNNGPYSIASWMLRPRWGNAHYEHLAGLGNKYTYDKTSNTTTYSNTPTAEIQNSLLSFPLKGTYVGGGSRPSRVPTTMFVFSIRRSYNDDSIEFLVIHGTDIRTNTEISTIQTTNLLIVEQREVFDIDRSKEDYYCYSDIAGIIKTYVSDAVGIPGLTKEQYYEYLNNPSDYTTVEKIGESNWYSGYFKEEGNFIFKKYINNKGTFTGLYTIDSGKDPTPSDLSIGSNAYSEKSTGFYVDSSIVSFFSPEIEHNQNILSNIDYTFRIIGIVPINSTNSDIILETNNTGIADFSGLDKRNINNLSNTSLFNAGLYKDYGWNGTKISKDTLNTYYIYLWNKSGSIIGQTADATNSDGSAFNILHADLKHKVISNKRKSNSTIYISSDILNYNVSPTVFNSDTIESKILKLKGKNVIYQGNYDNLVVSSSPYKVMYNSRDYNSRPSNGRPDNSSSSSRPAERPNIYADLNQSDPVRIKYNTTAHAVFELKGVDDSLQILPYLKDNEEDKWDISNLYPNDVSDDYSYSYPWIDNDDDYNQKYIGGLACRDTNTGYHLPYLFIGELVRTIDNDLLYGGSDENALERIKWIPASLATPITDSITESYGDTYYQRWECLTTYPSTEEDLNSVVDIVSFMVETHINLEGRYDKNKNIENSLNARKNNFNKVNTVYSQEDNFFTYNILDEKFNSSNYESQIVFSLPKEPSSDIDTWTNISLVNALNLNGLYGKLNKLENFNNNIIAFQDKAISSINYNNRTALSTEAGVPIEIANSGKVNGYSIISDVIGCQNKDSICRTSSGLFFIDDLNKSLFMFNREGVSNISSSKGMSIWFKNNLTGKEKVSYDFLTHDVYISNKDYCLSYNEDFQSFISFYDYNNIDTLFNLNKESVVLKTDNNKIVPSIMFKGNYTPSYSITYRVNPEPLTDKIFTNVEFLADFYDTNSPDIPYSFGETGHSLAPFNKLRVWNEYQEGIVDGTGLSRRYPNFEKKFRTWRVDIPRDKNNHRDRIRNPWIMLKLSRNDAPNNRMVFHNLAVKYFK